MGTVDYAAAFVPVRDDLPAAHRRAWQHLARPGRYLSGAQRVAAAAEVRAAWSCSLCRERKQALLPAAVSGVHDGPGELPEAMVDAIHRITTDPGALSRHWFDGIREAGVSDGQYVELVGVVVTLVSVDQFCRGLGVPPHALPKPDIGEPSGERPQGLRDDGAWVPMLDPRRSGPDESDLYPGGGTGNVLRALSLSPDEVRNLKQLSAAHYLTPEQMADLQRGTAALDRAQVELLAARVSALRECFY
jgi:alkylhydroperoxidase family enzyme